MAKEKGDNSIIYEVGDTVRWSGRYFKAMRPHGYVSDKEDPFHKAFDEQYETEYQEGENVIVEVGPHLMGGDVFNYMKLDNGKLFTIGTDKVTLVRKKS